MSSSSGQAGFVASQPFGLGVGQAVSFGARPRISEVEKNLSFQEIFSTGVGEALPIGVDALVNAEVEPVIEESVHADEDREEGAHIEEMPVEVRPAPDSVPDGGSLLEPEKWCERGGIADPTGVTGLPPGRAEGALAQGAVTPEVQPNVSAGPIRGDEGIQMAAGTQQDRSVLPKALGLLQQTVSSFSHPVVANDLREGVRLLEQPLSEILTGSGRSAHLLKSSGREALSRLLDVGASMSPEERFMNEGVHSSISMAVRAPVSTMPAVALTASPLSHLSRGLQVDPATEEARQPVLSEGMPGSPYPAVGQGAAFSVGGGGVLKGPISLSGLNLAVIELSRGMSEAGRSERSLAIATDAFGKIGLKLTMEEGRVAVAFAVERHEALEAIKRNLPHLTEGLKDAGYSAVTYDFGGYHGGMPDQPRGRGGGGALEGSVSGEDHVTEGAVRVVLRDGLDLRI